MNRDKQKLHSSKGRASIVEKREKVNVIGLFFVAIQFLISVFFIALVWELGVLPQKFFTILVALILFLFAGVLLSQLIRKKSFIITGRSFGALFVAGLVVSSSLAMRANRMIADITASPAAQTSTILVAVKADDPAESIQDTATYSFGVQKKPAREQIEPAIAEINKTLRVSIENTEYDNLSALVSALYADEVQAIIYNKAFSENINEEFEGYKDSVKIIYQFTSTEENPFFIQPVLNSVKIATDANASPFMKDEAYCILLGGEIEHKDDLRNTTRYEDLKGLNDLHMIAVINPETRQIMLVSTPRDYFVELPGITNGAKDKLCHSNIYGVNTSIAALNNIYDIELEGYVRMNIDSFIAIIDLLGGLEIHSEEEFTTSRELLVEKGLNQFTGEESLIYASEEWYKMTSDMRLRGQNRQKVVDELIQSITSPSVLKNADLIMQEMGKGVKTSFSKADIQTLISEQLNSGEKWNIQSVSTVGKSSFQTCYSYSGTTLHVTIPDMNSVNEVKGKINNIMNGEPLPEF